MIYFKRLILAIFGKSLKREDEPIIEHKIEYYEDAETYPYKRSQRFYKFMAKSAETGDNPIDFFKRLDLAFAFYNNKQTEEGNIELSNLRLAWIHCINEYSPLGAAEAISVKSIDGVMCDDITTDGLEATLQKLSDIGLTRDDIKNHVTEIKKKSKTSWRYFTEILSMGKTQSLTAH